MKRKINLRMLILTGALTIALILLSATTSKAVLQSNPTTHANPIYKSGAAWIKEIRQMEATGQTMGLNEKINNNLDSTTGDNNIDVHMIKSTEYGAVAILSISGFGNKDKLQDSAIKSTTGNVTGVYFSRDNIVAGVQNNAQVTANAKYYNRYGTTYADGNTFVGDALGDVTWAKTPGSAILVAPGRVSTFHGGWFYLDFLFGGNGTGIVRTPMFGLDRNAKTWGDEPVTPVYSRGVAV